MVDDRQYYESIGDILAAAQTEAIRAIPLESGAPVFEITFVDLLTAIVLDRDVLHELVDGRGLSPQVRALRERRNPPPTLPPTASTRSDLARPRYVRIRRAHSRERTLAPALRTAVDASRARFAAIDHIGRPAFIDIAFANDRPRADRLRNVESMTGLPAKTVVAPHWPILIDLLDRCTASGDDIQRALDDLQLAAADIRNTITIIGLRTP